VRSIIILATVAVISLLAGIAVTGLPKDVSDDVRSDDISVATAASSTTTTAQRASTMGTEPLAGGTAPGPNGVVTSTVVPVGSLRIVVANAGGAAGVAARVAAELRGLGYGDVSATNAVTPRQDTVLVFAPGFEPSAARVAADLGFAAQRLEPEGASALTADAAPADVWILLGRDQQ
jgi:hypothetical protein